MYKIEKFEGENIFALLDPILVTDLIQNWLKCHSNVKVYNLFDSTINSHIDLLASPLLLDVTYINIKEINELIRNVGEISPSLSIFSTNLDIKELLLKFKFMMFPEVRGKATFFRFYDPIFFSRLNEIYVEKNAYDGLLDVYSLIDVFKDYKENYIIKKVV